MLWRRSPKLFDQGLTHRVKVGRVQARAHKSQLLAPRAVQPWLHPPLRCQQAEQLVAVHVRAACKGQPCVC